MVPQKQILIVEDNDINRAMLYEILSEKYAVLEAENGQQALDILKQKKDSISLILLDVIMPVMDGYSFLARIREDAELSLIPVILMTQNSSEEDEVEGLARGATDFVPKPYRPQVILHRVASIIKLRETAAMVNQFQFDRLTGLYSKEFFYQKVRQRLLENPEKDYWIVCSNIENFKLFNDAFGPQSGDRLLVELAGIVQSTGGSDGLCGRFGADHFLCFQERTSAQRFLEAVEQENSPLIKSVVMRWGAYEVTDPFIHVEQMCDRALLAANSIKGRYDQYFAVYDDSLRSKLLREQAITDAMETALEQKQFLVYLQPKYSLKDDCMIGAEALVRWIHPVWGFISPGEFIPLFEKNGFIPRLDQYAWEHVCALLRDWKQRGYPLLPISVNISRSDVYQLNLVDTLLELTQRYGIDPKYLHLEITETAYADNPSQIITTVNQLRQLGFPIEMDDFGSGYSSLNMLSQMKLDVLKLDMKFVQNEIAKPAEQSILDDVIAMAHRMKLGVVAEGIETLAQVKRLRGMGCDYAQGFFFAKPMPAAEFEALWENQRKTQGQKVEPAQRESSKRLLLVVDEDDGYRKKVCMSFAAQYEVLEASDVHRAQACIQENRNVSVIILSMTLPDNGASMVMKMLREAPDLWRIPVVATIPNGEEAGMLSRALDADDFLCKRHPVFDLHRRVDHLVELVEAHRRERILKEEASRDYLTGLLNRRGLKAALDGLKKEDMPLATYLFDLDNLKITNDTYGHDVGDQMIMVFADLLRKQTRADDILCRYGGDEFLVVLKNMKTEAEAAAKGQFICQAFRDSMEAMSISMSCSAGIALCAEDENPSHSLIDHADRAMLRVKRENKGGCSLWRGDWEEKQSS